MKTKKISLFTFFSFCLLFSCQCQVIEVELKEKVRVKTALDYEKVAVLNPDIKNFDIRAGDLEYEDIKVRIGIFNENRNNKYNENGIDYLIVGDYKDSSLSIDKEDISCLKIIDKHILQVKNYLFLVEKIAEDGSKVVLRRITGSSKPTIKYIEELPTDTFTDFEGKKIYSFENFKMGKKYIYVYFWASWCSYCIPKLSKINQLQQKYASKVQILGFCGDTDDYLAQKTIEEYKISWPQFKPNSFLSENLKHVAYPHSLLADSRGKIIKWSASVEDIIAILEQK